MSGLQGIDEELAARAHRFRALKATGEGAPLQALSLEITRRCIARCVMCNIWKTPKDLPELSAEQWLSVLRSPILHDLRELDITGGEPFLRDDIEELLLGIGDLYGSNLTRLSSVAITTNGFLTDRILEVIGRVAPAYRDEGLGLVFACGLDAIGEKHDLIRRYKDGFARLDRTIDGLIGLRERYGNLVIGAKTTITRLNVDEVDAVMAYADERGLFTIVSPYIVTPARYGNLDLDDALAFSDEDVAKLRAFYDGDRFKWSYFRDELRHFLDTGRMDKPCTAGFNYAFVRSTGDVYPCPLIDTCVGNVTERPLEEILDTDEARAFRRGVGDHEACATCTEPGLERYALPFEGGHYLELWRTLGPDAFAQLHAHMGLDKYF
jgi:MoaA/NifB/PqqE/SkfB family radical SAM enzyme